MKDTIAINLSSAAHSRFEGFAFNSFFTLGGKLYGTNALGVFRLDGDLDYGSQPIPASATTCVSDLNVQELKRISDAYVQARTDGELTLDLHVDETEIATELPFAAPYNLDNGVRRLRAKLPRGAKGTNWQFKISNVDGCRFTAFKLQVAPVASARTV